jgi:hypothetical protein
MRVHPHDRLLDAQLNKRLVHEFSLSGCRPGLRPGPVGVTKARPIKGDDAISLSQSIEYPADFEILHHGAIAVQEDDRRSIASIEIMKVNTVDIEEAAGGRVVPLGLTGAASDQQRRGSQDGRRDQSSHAQSLQRPSTVSRQGVAVHNFLQ